MSQTTKTRTTSRYINDLDEVCKTLMAANAIKGSVRLDDRAIGAAAIIDGVEIYCRTKTEAANLADAAIFARLR